MAGLEGRKQSNEARTEATAGHDDDPCGEAGPVPGISCGNAPKFRYRKPADRRSRPQRWRDAVAELLELQTVYQAWLDALPENLAVSATADALREICGLDLSEVTSVEPPRGFGRD
jgi:hypothetical protein